jgi:hypothetical protein
MDRADGHTPASRHANKHGRERKRDGMNLKMSHAYRYPARAAHHALTGHSGAAFRKTSRTRIAGLPLFEIAFGPQHGKPHGHAKALVAIGDHATGVLAIGGLAQGVVAIGGLSEGLIALGGCTFGLLAALGGVAVGAFAMGGVALGGVTLGGVSIGSLSAQGRESVAPYE